MRFPVLLGPLVLASSLSLAPSAAFAQTSSPAPTDLTRARTFSLEDAPSRTMPNGGKSYDLLRGTLTTGEVVGVHETTLPVGSKPNAAHIIEHTELIMVREGTVAFEHDGKAERVSAGGAILVAVGTLHAMRNVGTIPATYFVIQIGGNTNK